MQKIVGDEHRIIGLDLLRCCAILFVIAGHFFSLNTEFRTSVFEGVSMFIQGAFSMLFASGVPLFIMLTGYLNCNKTVSLQYYRGGIKVLVSYLFFSIVTILFRKYYMHDTYSWIEWGLKILDFSAIPYGWYIEMWIGMFLLTPFLNMLYKAVPTKRQKQILILTLYLLTALPDLLNRYGLYLVPGFWAQCFPLTFFFIGSYIREYRPDFRKWKLVACLVVFCLINPVFNIVYKSIFGPHTEIHIAGGPWGVFGTVIAVSIFLLLYQIDFRLNIVRSALTNISKASLDMYLCCYILDKLVYPYFLKEHFISQSQFGLWFFIIIPILFVGAYVIAWIKGRIFALFRSSFA